MEHTLELKDKKIILKPLSFKKSLSFAKNSDKINFFEFVKKFLDEVTSLDFREIDELLFQDAISIMIYYRMLFFDNEPLSDDGITPKDFLMQKPNYDEKIMEIGGFRFTNLITLKKMAEAERFCYLNKEPEFMGVYLLCGACLKSLGKGKEILIDNAIDSKEFREQIKTLNFLIGSVSHTKIDLLFNLENISIVNQNQQALVLEDNFFFWD